MPRGFYKELVKMLSDAGCTFVRPGKGDHEIWYSPITKRNFSVDKGTTNRHLANRNLKDAGLSKAF
ncbi:MAG: type II toxin-antitoxin system HicA family toxin [Proteobacteria bacterium]|nr:type II toxin-antitoxin system HicA family toxin [Pseudomonadota bacterium]